MTLPLPKSPSIAIIGGGLAGSEAALQLAKRHIPVMLYDMKPAKTSPAHHNQHLAEIVCSNSFGSQGETASGLLKQEMMVLDCELLKIARSVAVPAGQALAVDREAFSAKVTETIAANPFITFVGEEQHTLPEADIILIATGPMTSEGLAKTLSTLVNRQQLFFFDAASPIITKESINFDIAFVQDRYGKTEDGSAAAYINCPLDETQYNALVQFILAAEKTELKAFETSNSSDKTEKTHYFESCLPVEVIASRGIHTLSYGPMKPVGLVDPRTGKEAHAVVQLRQDNAEGTLYNMVGFQTNIKWGPQKAMIQMIPGLENADVVRYGVMHRNTYLHSPEVLLPTLQLKAHPHIFIGGQLTGTEGYTESVATGMMAAINIARLVQGQQPTVLPRETMLGSLLHYVTREEAVGKDFQPINSNWGIMPPLGQKIRNKKERGVHYAQRALKTLDAFKPNLLPDALAAAL